MTVLITGGTGTLGGKLESRFDDVEALGKEEMDVEKLEEVREVLKEVNPDLVIHLAAITSVELCERHKEKAWSTNVEGTHHVAKICDEVGAKMVLMSTPCVFSGEEAPYYEDDTPNPTNFYGITKMSAENVLRYGDHVEDWLIIRGNFVEEKEWPYEKAFTDRYGTYLFADQIAEVISKLVESKTGIYHIVGGKKLSMYDLAKITTEEVGKITLDEYEGPSLTRDMSLETKKLKKFSIAK